VSARSDQPPTPADRLHELAELGAATATLLHELRHAVFVLQAQAALEPDRDRLAAAVTEGVRELGALLDAYGSLARGGAERSSHDLNDEVARLLPALRAQARGRGAEIELALHPDRLTIRAAALSPRQILVNLVRNALDAVADAPERRVRITTAADSHGVALIVDDSGPGLDGVLGETIFEPWVTSKGASGTGLGLPLSRSLVAADGGTLTAGPSPLGGARFVARWPAPP
jgi:C4-dicarboxylate-specific signal transduction histidine kinase